MKSMVRQKGPGKHSWPGVEIRTTVGNYCGTIKYANFYYDKNSNAGSKKRLMAVSMKGFYTYASHTENEVIAPVVSCPHACMLTLASNTLSCVDGPEYLKKMDPTKSVSLDRPTT